MTLTSLPGILVGHATRPRAATGCTVIICPDGAIAGCDVGGGAAGTRELDACRPEHLVARIHALLLTGGSAFGLDAASGVMDELERRGTGFDTGTARVPIVPAAVLYDLGIGDSGARPDAAMGRAACRDASSRPVRSGCVGAGTGATVGKLFGLDRATKAGLGNASIRMPARAGGATVAALAVVNAFGDVVDPETSVVIAGARLPAPARGFAGTERSMARGIARRGFGSPNTTLVVVATDARLDRVQASRLARQCQDGIARCVRPAHTRFDGDIVFALSVGSRRADPDGIAVAACRAIGEAVVDAVRSARPLGGVPSAQTLK